jgi:acyl transferase domain-containing protein/acyl carrier protein
MALELLDSSPVFAEQMRVCGGALAEYVDWSLEDVLRGVDGAAGLDRVDVVQPVLFAVMVSLAALWRACGVRPSVVVGHSQGEIAAAYVAGGLSLEDAARVVALRSRALVGLAGKGGMVSVALPVSELEGHSDGRLERWGARIGVAAVNGPSSVVVSGDRVALEEFLRECELEGVRAREIPVDYAAHSAQVEEIREELLEGCAAIAPRRGDVPFFSTVTGGLLDTAELDGEYWYRNLRETVQFERATRVLLEDGQRAFIEVSPHPVLTLGVQDSIDEVLEDADGVVVVGSLRRGQGGSERFLRSLSEVWVRGVRVDWGALFQGSGAKRVGLPTYAFQRERYWLSNATPGSGDATSIGQSSTGHPLLGAMVALAEDRGWLFTGRVSLESHPWLRDYALAGSPLMPGAGFVELALAAGEWVGAGVVEQLTLERALPFGDEGAVQLQLSVSEPDADGKRSIGIHSRPLNTAGDEPAGGEWIRHASGVLGGSGDGSLMDGRGLPDGEEPEGLGDPWPPADARALDTEFLYERLADAGYDYGPFFQKLQAAWRVGDELYAEMEFESERTSDEDGFYVHPALLDCMLHAALLRALDDTQSGELEVPFAFSGVRCYGPPTSVLRVHIGSGAEAGTLRLRAFDEDGALVLSAQAVELRALDPSQLRVATHASHETLYELRWVELQGDRYYAATNGSQPRVALLGESAAIQPTGVELERHTDLHALECAVEEGAAAPELVLIGAGAIAGHTALGGDRDAVGGLAENVLRITARTLELLQAWIASETLSEARLVLITDGAVAVAESDAPNLTQAALAGLMRSAQSEHPGRFGLVDLDGSEIAIGPLYGALGSDEPQLALREGSLYTPRLTRLKTHDQDPPDSLDPQGTVLITDGTGDLGTLLARHLVVAHGARHVLLVSNSEPEVEGARELLEAELRELGCDVRIAACDTSDRAQLQKLLASVPEEHPLSVVVHAASVLDDGVIESLDGERLSRVMAAKVDAAVNLHELAGQAELILCSSAAAVVGSPGQGNYAAANSFLDALACHRRAHGLPGMSLAWGAWGRSAGMVAELGAAERMRLERQGMYPLSDEQALGLFDSARGIGEPLLLAMHLNTAALRVQAKAGMLPAVFRGLLRTSARRTRDTRETLVRRLARSPESEWEGMLMEFVSNHVADVLGHASSEEVDPRRPFKEAGFDSLTAVELRNRLSQASGLKLPSTLAFDHPTPAAVAEFLRSRMTGEQTGQAALDEEIDKFERMLVSSAGDGAERERISGRLRSLLAKLADDGKTQEAVTVEMIQSASADEIVELIQMDLTES